MSAILAAFGGQAIGWIVAGAVGLIAVLLGAKTLKNSGAADQRAADTQKGLNDVSTAAKARAGVDALPDSGVDDQLRRYQRK